MLAAIDLAHSSMCLKVYIFAPSPLGERIREALVRAQQRGMRLQVLVDALAQWICRAIAGSLSGLSAARRAGSIRSGLMRFWFRDHRKLLVCDGRVTFVGGFDIAPEYEGDGVRSGSPDLDVRLEGPLAAQLAFSFEGMFRARISGTSVHAPSAV